MARTRWSILLTVVLVAGCGSGGGSVPTSSGTPGGGGAAATPAAPSASGFAFNFSLPPAPTWPPVGGKVRVVNLYQPGTEAPFAIDVRQAGVLSTSAPIATVQPGTASDYFDPGDSGDGSAELDFYRAGTNDPVDLVMHQGWSNMKGRQITIVLFTSFDFAAAAGQRNNGGAYVIEEQGGTNPLPTVAPGKGLLWVDTQSLDSLPQSAQWPQAALGLGDGTCLADDKDKATNNGFSFLGGQTGYTLVPGTVKVSIWGNVSHVTDCTGAPDFGPVPVTLTAGTITWLILSGVDVKHLKTTTLSITP